MITFRQAGIGDESLLRTFLYHAIYVPDGYELPAADIVFTENFIQYTDSFGTKAMDLGIIAEDNGNPIGAAWIRLINGYGHLDDAIPELAISVIPEYRGKGIGTALLCSLIKLTGENGCKAISLSVQAENTRAVRLYRKAGFMIAKEDNGELLMKLELDCLNSSVFALLNQYE